MAAGVIAAAWGWQREPPSISLTTNSHEDGWRCTPQLISIYKGKKGREGRDREGKEQNNRRKKGVFAYYKQKEMGRGRQRGKNGGELK